MKGIDDTLDRLIDDPYPFYGDVLERVQEKGLRGFEPCLFTSPCKYCSRSMVFTHKDSNYD